jgi:hypothetical protein
MVLPEWEITLKNELVAKVQFDKKVKIIKETSLARKIGFDRRLKEEELQYFDRVNNVHIIGKAIDAQNEFCLDSALYELLHDVFLETDKYYDLKSRNIDWKNSGLKPEEEGVLY